MTSQSSTTNIKHAGFAPLFGFSAKQFWTTILLFTIVLFFVLPVPVLMTISGRTINTADDFIRLKNDFAEDWCEVIRYFAIIITATFGIVVSCARFGYLKSKVSIDFYHSLPVKRRQLFLTQLGVGAIALVIPYLFNILFTLIVFASNGLISELLLANILTMSWEVFVYTLFCFSISTLVGMISGLTAVQLTLTLVAIFIVPAIVIASIAFAWIFNENMWVEFYITPQFFEKLSPPLRLIINNDPLSLLESILMVLISAAMLIGAYAIYMKRKSERAGTPVVFTPLGEVIKYVLVFLGTLGGGLLFYAMMEDLFWTVFGMACGMILVFMLTNTILNKTARAMFKGWKGLCIFGAVVAVGFIILLTNAFGINTRIPSPEFTSHVKVSFGDGVDGLEFRDQDVIEAVSTIYKNSEWRYIPYKNDIARQYERVGMEVVFYPKFGIPVAKAVTVYNKSDFIEEFRTILDSEEFKEQYASAFDNFTKYDEGYISLDLPRYSFDKETGKPISYHSAYDYWRFKEFNINSVEAKRFALAELKEANKACGFDFFQQQSFASVRIDTYGYYMSKDATFPIFNSMDEVVDKLLSSGIIEYTPEEYNKKMAVAIDKITVYHPESGKFITVTDKAHILEILNAAVSSFHNNSITSYTFADPKYFAEFSIEVTETADVHYYYEDGISYTEVVPRDKEDVYTYTNNYEIAFLLGKTPDFIIRHFE
ncbi:MAG: hypothetical protein IJF48_00550 [Clostridia bacterium]|nr:hypothetical protein [Clostridia bacterium]